MKTIKYVVVAAALFLTTVANFTFFTGSPVVPDARAGVCQMYAENCGPGRIRIWCESYYSGGGCTPCSWDADCGFEPEPE